MQTHNRGDQVMATVQVWNLESEDVGASLQTFKDVPADWAVRYAYAESVGRLPKLFELREANAYEAEVNIFFHVSRGPRSVSCGDFAASTEEDE